MAVGTGCAHGHRKPVVKQFASAHCLLRSRHGVEVEEVVEKTLFRDLASERGISMGLLRLVFAAKVLWMEDCVDCRFVLAAAVEAQASLLAV